VRSNRPSFVMFQDAPGGRQAGSQPANDLAGRQAAMGWLSPACLTVLYPL
jgi:hypothetical protein